MSEELIQYIIIIAYFAFIVIKGIRHSKDISNQEDFLVAGRNIGWFMLLSTMSATVIGGGASIGAIGKTYEWGLLMVLVSTGVYMQFIFSGWLIAPYFRKAKLITVAGFFGHRYDEKVRFVSFILSLVFSIGVLGAQMVAFGKIITTMLPVVDYQTAVIIGAAIVIVYSTAGGLHAVIHTDFIQFIVLVFGFAITLIFCIPDLLTMEGNIAAMVPEDFLTIDGGKGWVFLITTFIAFLLGETFAPGYATRFGVGKSVRDTKKGIIGAGLLLTLTFPLVLFVIALFAKIHFPDINPEQALPQTILYLHNPIISGLIIAALMSAVMSSADTILNSSTAIFSKDLLEHYFAKDKKEIKNGLLISRISSIGLGAIGLLMALLLPNIIDLLLLTYSLWAPSVIIPVLAGVLMKRKSRFFNNLIFTTMIVSSAATIIFMTTPYKETLQPLVFGVAVSLVIFAGGLFMQRFILSEKY